MGVHPQTGYVWVGEDRMAVPFRRLPSGAILVDVAAGADERVVRYARVCGHDRRWDLDRRVARLTEWATDARPGGGRGWLRVERQAPEAGPNRVGPFCHSDRRGASGSAGPLGDRASSCRLAAQGRRVVVVDDGESTDDLVGDMIEVLTCRCARLDGRRGARNRAMAAVTAAKHPPSVQATGSG